MLCSIMFSFVMLVEGAGCGRPGGYSVDLGIWRPRYAGWAGREVCSGDLTTPTCRVGSTCVMLCHTMLCCVMICYVMLCYVMLCSVMFCSAVPCFGMLSCSVLSCYVLLSCSALSCSGLSCSVLSCNVLMCYVLFSFVMIVEGAGCGILGILGSLGIWRAAVCRVGGSGGLFLKSNDPNLSGGEQLCYVMRSYATPCSAALCSVI